jgi:hypothetical protein
LLLEADMEDLADNAEEMEALDGVKTLPVDERL